MIATANDRDRGVNQMSSALARRFNTVVLPPPATEDDEVQIVTSRASQLGRALQLPAEPPALDEVRRVVRIFRELRATVHSGTVAQLPEYPHDPAHLVQRRRFGGQLERLAELLRAGDDDLDLGVLGRGRRQHHGVEAPRER